MSKSGKGGIGFQAEPLERLQDLAKESASEAQELAASIPALIQHIASSREGKGEKPVVAFFEGKEAVQRVVMESLYCKEKKIESIAPQKNFFWDIGYEFVERYVGTRGKRGIKTRNLWERSIDPDTFNEYYEGKSDVRVLPENMRGAFKTTIFIYDDKTLYISSLKSGYCILVTSREHAQTMRAIFEGLWSCSTPHAKSR